VVQQILARIQAQVGTDQVVSARLLPLGAEPELAAAVDELEEAAAEA
jgi:hypothetical protein